MRKRGTRARCDDRRKWKTLAPLVSQRLLQRARHFELGHTSTNLRQRVLERACGDSVRAFDQCYLLIVLPLAQRLYDVYGWAPLPARAGIEQSLKVAVQQMTRFESRDCDVAQVRQLLPKTGPQALRLDADPCKVTDLFG